MIIERYSKSKHFFQWNDFIRTSKNGLFMFERNYMNYHSDRFEDYSLMVYDDNEKLICMLPANIKDNVLYSHQGLTFGGLICGKKIRLPLMVEIIEAIKGYCQDHSVQKIIYKAIPYFYHDQPSQEDIYSLYHAGAKMMRVDASSTIEFNDSRYAFSSARKSGLKKAINYDLQIEISDDYDGFFSMMNDLLENKYDTHATHSASEMQSLADDFPNNIKLYGCFLSDEMVSGTIIYSYKNVWHTQYIASSHKGRDIGAQDILLNKVIEQASQKVQFFDFGISTESAGTVLNENLIDQKEGFGARTTIHQFFELEI